MKYCWGCMSEISDNDIICPYCGYDNKQMMNQSFCLRAGTMLRKRFIVGKVLGSGGFGITYIARDTTLHRKVAIKEYYPTSCAARIVGKNTVAALSEDAEEEYIAGLDRFVNEARRLAVLGDIDGVVRVFDCFRENNTAYLVMELLEGETIKDYIKRKRRLKREEAIAIICIVLDSLQKIYEKNGIIHRDVSPDNIFLTKDKKIKLIDFGAARSTSYNATRSLSVILKPGYAPEEQYRTHGEQGPWTDVYGSGATLYWMLTGVRPQSSIDRLVKDELRPPIELGVDISKAQQAVLMKSLNLKAKDRYQSAEEFRQELLKTENLSRGPIHGLLLSRIIEKACLSIKAFFRKSGAGIVRLKKAASGFIHRIKTAFRRTIERLSPGLVVGLVTLVLAAVGIGFFLGGKYESGPERPESGVSPVPEPTATEAPRPTATQAPTNTPQPTVTQAPEPTATPWPTATPTVTEWTPAGFPVVPESGVYTARNNVNIRADAFLESDIITGVLAGTTLIGTGKCDNGWIRVEYDGKTGYVAEYYVVKNDEVTLSDTAEEQTPGGIAVTVTSATYKANNNLNIRIDASKESDIITGVLSGTILKCTGICQNGWIRVEYDGKTGYVSGDYVSLTS